MTIATALPQIAHTASQLLLACSLLPSSFRFQPPSCLWCSLQVAASTINHILCAGGQLRWYVDGRVAAAAAATTAVAGWFDLRLLLTIITYAAHHTCGQIAAGATGSTSG